jgi:hydroxylamine dehydrogenase
MGLVLVALTIGRSVASTDDKPVNALATSTDECVTCHRRTTPGIVEQYGHSAMAAAEVSCSNCHAAEADYPGAVEHEGAFALPQPTTAMCQRCHAAEVAQYNQSRHGLPAYVAYAATGDLTPELLEDYQSIPEGGFTPGQMRNALYAKEGPAITRFACEAWHNIGKPQADGSVGECWQPLSAAFWTTPVLALRIPGCGCPRWPAYSARLWPWR